MESVKKLAEQRHRLVECIEVIEFCTHFCLFPPHNKLPERKVCLMSKRSLGFRQSVNSLFRVKISDRFFTAEIHVICSRAERMRKRKKSEPSTSDKWCNSWKVWARRWKSFRSHHHPHHRLSRDCACVAKVSLSKRTAHVLSVQLDARASMRNWQSFELSSFRNNWHDLNPRQDSTPTGMRDVTL